MYEEIWADCICVQRNTCKYLLSPVGLFSTRLSIKCSGNSQHFVKWKQGEKQLVGFIQKWKKKPKTYTELFSGVDFGRPYGTKAVVSWSARIPLENLSVLFFFRSSFPSRGPNKIPWAPSSLTRVLTAETSRAGKQGSAGGRDAAATEKLVKNVIVSFV